MPHKTNASHERRLGSVLNSHIHRKQFSSSSVLLGRLLLACAALSLLVGCMTQTPQQYDPETLPSVVESLMGQVQYSYNEGKTWRDAKVHDVLQTGCVIRTSSGSLVRIALGRTMMPNPTASLRSGDFKAKTIVRATFRLNERSVLGIDELMRKRDHLGLRIVDVTKLDLRLGTMSATVEMLNGPSMFEVKFPEGDVNVRGGRFWMNAKGALRVEEGTADIHLNNRHQTFTVTSLHRFNPDSGEVTKVEPIQEFPFQ